MSDILPAQRAISLFLKYDYLWVVVDGEGLVGVVVGDVPLPGADRETGIGGELGDFLEVGLVAEEILIKFRSLRIAAEIPLTVGELLQGSVESVGSKDEVVGLLE